MDAARHLRGFPNQSLPPDGLYRALSARPLPGAACEGARRAAKSGLALGPEPISLRPGGAPSTGEGDKYGH